MNNARTRERIAAALSTVTGIKGYASTPSAPNVGDAWPQWRNGVRALARAYTQSWSVLIVIPQNDEVTADRYADERLDEIEDALHGVLTVDDIAPAEISGTPPLLALLINGHSE